MARILPLVVGQLQTNCYLLIDEDTGNTLIVDPGDDAEYIESVIAREKLKPLRIIATHGHFDHILAAAELQLAYNIPFLIHKKDEFLVKRMRDSAKYFTGVEAGPQPKINGNLKLGQIITIGSETFEVIGAPGHTPGSICLYDRKNNLAFVGDLLFAGGNLGRTDFSYSSQRDLNDSVAKILKFPGKTVLYSGHGPETTIAEERQFHKPGNITM